MRYLLRVDPLTMQISVLQAEISVEHINFTEMRWNQRNSHWFSGYSCPEGVRNG
jgi:hypothetical protein